MMYRKFWTASFCIAILGISTAGSAMAAQYTASAYPATATGSSVKGSGVLTTEGGKVECAIHIVTHSVGEATSTVAATSTYTNCEAFGFVSATVNMEGCSYLAHATSSTSTTVDVVCPAGQSIKITASTCKVEIKGQTGLKSVGTANSGGSIVLKPNIGGIAYTVTQDGFLCPFGGTGNKTGATVTGELTASRVGGGSISVS
jgi:hypothetical protein